MLGGNLLFTRATNNDSDNAYNQHNYSTTLTATIMPNKKWGLDLAYNFEAIQQNMNLCFEGAVVPGAFTCIGNDSLMEVLALYHTHAIRLLRVHHDANRKSNSAGRLQHRGQSGQYDAVQRAAAPGAAVVHLSASVGGN